MRLNFQNTVADFTDPNVCPHCHIVNTPSPIWQIQSKDTDNEYVFITAWTCSNQSCKKVFLALYKRVTNNQFQFARFLNGLPKGPIWPKPILELKEGNPKEDTQPGQTKFIKTYLQSLEAENSGLDEVAGMGYRKAIEYLVKDWAIYNKPEEKDKIQKLWLGQVISNYYDGDLKDILERATWLGNDQAHYNKLFEEYDISILKELIELIMVELDRQFKKKHYINTIQGRK
jgi:hypothetical protein